MPDIYEQLWNLFASHVKVSRTSAAGAPVDPTADVALDEQDRAGGSMLYQGTTRRAAVKYSHPAENKLFEFDMS